MSRRTRLAFINDKLIYKLNPRDRVSREILELAKGLEFKKMSSALERMKRRERSALTFRALLALMTLIVPVAILYFMFPTLFDLDYILITRDPIWMIPVFAVSIGLVAAFTALFHGRRV